MSGDRIWAVLTDEPLNLYSSFSFRSVALIGCYKTGIPVVSENISVTFWNNPLLRLIFGSFIVEKLDDKTGDVCWAFPRVFACGKQNGQER